MKKGDIKKQEIMQTAEMLFCRYGYNETSVQDILDAIHTSKGSFYHHFISKEALLAAICAIRADEASESIYKQKVSSEDDVITQLNALFTGMIPLNGEKLAFLMMLLPVFSEEEGVYVRYTYCEHLLGSFKKYVISLIEKGHEERILFCKETDFYAEMTLRMINWMWCKICDLIIQNEKRRTLTDCGELLAIIESCRFAIEKLLYLPFGSIILLDLNDIKNLAEQIHMHWKNKD